ncbi:MAG: hypothetical protein O2960_21690 [Verrucomicrobia bacterium]|nr:hypothetical protein [Verrucomicrobiota bacterium]
MANNPSTAGYDGAAWPNVQTAEQNAQATAAAIRRLRNVREVPAKAEVQKREGEAPAEPKLDCMPITRLIGTCVDWQCCASQRRAPERGSVARSVREMSANRIGTFDWNTGFGESLTLPQDRIRWAADPFSSDLAIRRTGGFIQLKTVQ